MKKSQKFVKTFVIILTITAIFLLNGCAKMEHNGSQADKEVTPETLEAVQEAAVVPTAAKVQTVVDTAQTYSDEQDVETGGTMKDWDEIIRTERAELEAKVQVAGGISEEKAVALAQKAMETDLGEKAKELKLCVNETYGWSSDLCVADWSEIQEKDKGALAYSVGFNNAQEGMEIDSLLNYCCVLNAVDGSILEAYTIQGLDKVTYYEH